MKRLVQAATALLLLACSQPDYEEVKRRFNAENPGCKALSAEPGEGDFDNVYIQITYTCGGSKARRAEWLYQKVDGRWQRAVIVTPARAIKDAVNECRDRQPRRVSNDIVQPSLRTRVEPDFSKCGGIRTSGDPVIEAVIGADGLVKSTRVVKATVPCIDQSAIDALRQWTFCPAERAGKPIEVTMMFTVAVNYRREVR